MTIYIGKDKLDIQTPTRPSKGSHKPSLYPCA